MIDTSARALFDEHHTIFRDSVRRFLAQELTPNIERWERERKVDRAFWRSCGDMGLLCPGVPQEYGGTGLDFLYNAIIGEEFAYSGCVTANNLHSDVNVDYLLHYGSEAQKQRWLPGMVSGEVITAIAMTEPGAGSDLKSIRTTARRDGDEYVINGTKTYITNGQNADLIIVVVKTDPEAGAKGVSLVLVEADRAGFARGRQLDKIGLHSSDTSELFFHDVRVPCTNLLGEENQGFRYLMSQLPRERLSISIMCQGSAQRAFDEAVRFTRERTAFGRPVLDFQNTRFELAAMSAKLQASWAHLDWCLRRHVDGKLTADEAAAAKLFHSEVQWEICDAALQLHGGAGYINEYPIARLWRDARVSRIYGGTSEIMKEIIGRTL
ncbi:acyl-CoA dehydrogenase family protein [Steroidobacter sp.]|uniref:acyl-CoA dehydrogenase family protein n=1 Tax=Steroidobacter sp. TaxID=1978227 RepID=UPI001A428BA0|nr:acyl-CoA dehydrogenase family protein [Steroidobacter sp.]MBL8270074.1 acyl-CoA dehydrogenase family protein [Steroidobacter sp.]